MEETLGKLIEKDDAGDQTGRSVRQSHGGDYVLWKDVASRILYLPFPIKITISHERYQHRAVLGIFQYFWIVRSYFLELLLFLLLHYMKTW